MASEGAGWIDIGGESTRPGAGPVDAEEEKKRVVPVIEALAKEGLTVSVDTTKASVAEAALDAGASIVNDISALSMDEAMAGVVARHNVPLIIMHMRGTPRTMQLDTSYGDLMAEVYCWLHSRIEFAAKAGIDPENIIVDPGLGFGKSVEGNLEILGRLREFKSLGRPVMAGPSRKSFIGKTLNAPDPDERLAGTLAACVLAAANGAAILRVHDVKEARRAAMLADAVSGRV
jgi:dihydropteroate synthase